MFLNAFVTDDALIVAIVLTADTLITLTLAMDKWEIQELEQ